MDGGGEPGRPTPGVRHADGAERAPRDAPRSGDRGTARSRRADVDGLETKTSAWPPSAGGTEDLATSVSETHPVSVTRRPARRPKADAGSPVSSRRRRVVRARCSAGTVWYFRSSIRKVISGRRDPAAVPAGSVLAAGSRCIVRVRGSVAERRKTETTINLGERQVLPLCERDDGSRRKGARCCARRSKTVSFERGRRCDAERSKIERFQTQVSSHAVRRKRRVQNLMAQRKTERRLKNTEGSGP